MGIHIKHIYTDECSKSKNQVLPFLQEISQGTEITPTGAPMWKFWPTPVTDTG